MEKTICFVVGLPGSGKTSYLEQLQKSGFVAINQPEDFEKDIQPYLGEQYQVLAIADHNLCFSANREKMVVKIRGMVQNVVFRWIYFDNDPVQCLSNLHAAGIAPGSERPENFIWQLSQGYSIPANIEVKPVVRSEERANPARLSYAPGSKEESAYKLVRVLDDLVLFSSPDWESFRATVWYILQKYPTHRYMIVEETITRRIKEIVFDRLANQNS